MVDIAVHVIMIYTVPLKLQSLPHCKALAQKEQSQPQPANAQDIYVRFFGVALQCL